jgi:hypothetical protein
MVWSLRLVENPADIELRLAPNSGASQLRFTLYLIGAAPFQSPQQRERFASILSTRHSTTLHPALIWHLGAVTDAGGMVIGQQKLQRRPEDISSFLAAAGDYGLWWPETWVKVSERLALLLGVGLQVALDIVFVQDRVTRAPQEWSRDAKDRLNRTFATLIQQRTNLDRDLGIRVLSGVTVVGAGNAAQCFFDIVSPVCMELDAYMATAEGIASASRTIPTSFEVKLHGMDAELRSLDFAQNVAPGWMLTEGEDSFILYPSKSTPLAQETWLLKLPVRFRNALEITEFAVRLKAN